MNKKNRIIYLILALIGLIWMLAVENQPSNNHSAVDNSVKVIRVIDGDTIEIEGGQRIRYIGIDTPELGQDKDCFATEAYERNRKLVEGKTIRLEKDVSETDRYGRLLRYVFVDDQFINEILVKEGYASAATFPPDVKYQELFIEAERDARENNRGLWSVCGV